MADFTLVIGNKNYSSWSLRPWLALKQTGVDFAEIRIPLDTPTTKAEIARYSPTGRVPVLLHGEITIWDSLAICEYVAELFPEAQLWPEDRVARAQARSISAEMHSGFPALRQNLSMDLRGRRPKEITPDIQAEIDRITTIWSHCRDKFGASGPFLFGAFTIADAMYAPVVSRFVTYGVKLDPVAQGYVAAIWSLPTFQDWAKAATAEIEDLPNH